MIDSSIEKRLEKLEEEIEFLHKQDQKRANATSIILNYMFLTKEAKEKAIALTILRREYVFLAALHPEMEQQYYQLGKQALVEASLLDPENFMIDVSLSSDELYFAKNYGQALQYANSAVKKAYSNKADYAVAACQKLRVLYYLGHENEIEFILKEIVERILPVDTECLFIECEFFDDFNIRNQDTKYRLKELLTAKLEHSRRLSLQ